MRYLSLIRPLTLVTLLTLFGCGGTTSTSETATPAETARDTGTTPATPNPPAPNTVQQEPVPRPTTTRAPESRPVAPKATVPQRQPATTPEPPPVVVDAGTAIEVTIDQTLSSKTSNSGDRFDASVASPIVVGETVVIPAGSKVSGTITEAQSAGKVQGKATLGIKLDSVTVRGSTYKLQTGAFQETGGSRAKRTGIGAAAGAAAGAVIGAIAGGGKGAAIGAGAGAGAGTVGAVLTGDRDIEIPAETRLSFKLSEPVSIKTR